MEIAATKLSETWVGEHIKTEWPDALEAVFPKEFFTDAQNEIATWEGYQATPVHSLDEIAKQCGVAKIYYKDESSRFGLGSFKALGGAYAVVNYLANTLSDQLGKSVSMEEVRRGKYADAASNITVATATDGNHGRSVAWGAMQAGCNCKIYIHAEVSKGREQAMAEFGADVVRINGDYDESVRLCAREAEVNNWQVISDTSYNGYVDVPRQVMAGYSVMIREILDELDAPPTHVIVQAGVGGLAASMCAALWSELGEKRPRFIVCESNMADCIIESMKNQKASHVPVNEETMMAGLSCGEISLIAWEILSRGTSSVVTIPDEGVAGMMRYMASQGIEAGECSVAGIISILNASKVDELRSAWQLNKNSRVLVFGTEGATDAEVYSRIINGADA